VIIGFIYKQQKYISIPHWYYLLNSFDANEFKLKMRYDFRKMLESGVDTPSIKKLNHQTTNAWWNSGIGPRLGHTLTN